MKKGILSISLILAILFSSSTFANAAVTTQTSEIKELLCVASAFGETEEHCNIVQSTSNESKGYIYRKNDTQIILPKEGSGVFEISSAADSQKITFQFPKEFSQMRGMKAPNGTVIYNSDKNNITAYLQIVEEKDADFEFTSLRTALMVKSASASNKIDFTFDLPEGYRLISSDDYKKEYYPDDHDWIGDDLVFVINKNGDIVSTIENFSAVDSNNRSVRSFYEIKGNKLTQVVDFDDCNKFPILVTSTTTGVKTKIETLSFTNTSANINKLVQARRDINERQNSSLAKVISLINSVFGLFNTSTGIMSMVIAGVIGGNAAFLEKCEDAYSYIEEEFLQNNSNKARIDYAYRGTYQGKNKGYVYKIQDISYNLTK